MSVSVFGKITVIKRNGSSGSQYPVTKNHCTFGRDADCEIRIQLPTVSDRECELRADENGNFILTKVNQEGEVLVNSKNVDSDATINHNDVLTIAGRSFRFEYPPTLKGVEISEEKMKNIATPKSSVLQRVKQTGSRRVSFGPQLSPEQFVAFMPPNTPVKKGATPMFGGTPKVMNRRRSVLKEAKGTPSSEVKNNKRKSIGKKPSPKIIKKQDTSNTKEENQCSFNDLVALVGLDNAPKSGKTTPARKSNLGKVDTPVQNKAKTPVCIKSSTKRGRNEDVSGDGIVLSINDPSTPAGQTVKSDQNLDTSNSAGVENQHRSSGMFTPSSKNTTPARRKSGGKQNTVETPKLSKDDNNESSVKVKVLSSKKRRSSLKKVTTTPVSGTSLDDTVPYEVSPSPTLTKKRRSSAKILTPIGTTNGILDEALPGDEAQKSKSGRKSRRSSAKFATPKVSKGCTQAVQITTDDLQKIDTPVGTKKRSKNVTPKASNFTPESERTDNDAITYIMNESTLDDTVPYIDLSIRKNDTPSMKRKSLKSPQSAGLTLESKERTAHVNDATMELLDEIALDDTVPYKDSTIEKNKTPKVKEAVCSDVSGEILDDTVPYEDSSVEENKTSSVGRKSLNKTPKSSGRTPNMKEAVGSVVPGEILDDTVPYEDSFVEKNKTPSIKRRSLNNKTPKSTGRTPKLKETVASDVSGEISNEIALDDTVPYEESTIEENKTPSVRERSLNKTSKSSGSTPKSQETTGEDSEAINDIKNISNLEDTMPFVDSPIEKNKTPSLKRKSLKTPKSSDVTQKPKESTRQGAAVPYVDLPIEKTKTPSMKKKSLNLKTPKISDFTPMSQETTEESSTLDDTVPYMDSPVLKNKVSALKRKSLIRKTQNSTVNTPKSKEPQDNTKIEQISSETLDATVPLTEDLPTSNLGRKSLKTLPPKPMGDTPRPNTKVVQNTNSASSLDATVPLIEDLPTSNLGRKSLKNLPLKPMGDTPRPNTKVVQNTNTASALDDTVPYIDSSLEENVPEDKRNSSKIDTPKMADVTLNVINDDVLSMAEEPVEDNQGVENLTKDMKRQSRSRKSINVATVENTYFEVVDTAKNRKSVNEIPKSTLGDKSTVEGDEDLSANICSIKTPGSAIKNLSDVIDETTEEKTLARVNTLIKKSNTLSGRKSLNKGVTPKMSVKKTPKQSELTPTRSMDEEVLVKHSTKKTPRHEKVTPEKTNTSTAKQAQDKDQKEDAAPLESEKGEITLNSSAKREAVIQITEESDELDSSYQELRITKKTPARKSAGKISTPRSNARIMESSEMDASHEEPHVAENILQNRTGIRKTPKSNISESHFNVDEPKIAPGRRSVPRKTPRRSVGSRLISRKSITKSSRRQSLRIKRKSGVLLWSEIVRKNADKQPEPKQTTAQMIKPVKRGRRSIAKTPKQLRAMRHIDSPATIYIGRRNKKTDELDMTPVDLDISTDYSSEESFVNDSMVSVGEENIVGQAPEPSKIMKVKGEEVKDHFGTKRLLKTPKEKKTSEPVNEKFGTKRIFKTPKERKKNDPVVEHFGTKRLFTTPKERTNGTPMEKDFGTKRLLRTPREVRSKSIDGDYCIDRLHRSAGGVEKASSGGEPRKRVKSQPVEHFGTKRLLKTPRNKVRNKSIDGDFCIDSLFLSEECGESAPSGGEVNASSEDPVRPETKIAPKKRSGRTTKQKKLDKEEVEIAPSSGDVTNKESAQSEIVVEVETRKPTSRVTRNTRKVTATKSKVAPSKAVVGKEEQKDDECGVAPVKRSTRKRRPPAHLDENVVTMAKKKLKSDATEVETEIIKDLPKRSSRARKGKDSVSTQKKTNGNTENLPIENSEADFVSVQKPKRAARKSGKSKVIPEALPTKRSTRSKVVKQTLEVIAEQDEPKVEATEKQPKTPNRGRSKKNNNIKDARAVEAKMTTSVETTSRPSRSTRRGKLTTIIEEVSVTTENTTKKVTFEAAEVVIASTTRQTRGRKNARSKVTTKSDQEVDEPTKKQSRSKISQEIENNKKVETFVQKRSTRTRKLSKEDSNTSVKNLEQNATENEMPELNDKVEAPVVKLSRMRKSKSKEETQFDAVLESETAALVPKRSSRTRKPSKNEKPTEITVPAPPRSTRARKSSKDEKRIENTATESKTPKRSARTRKTSNKDVDVKHFAKVRKTTSKVQNKTKIVEPMKKKPEPASTTRNRTRKQKLTGASPTNVIAKTTRKRRTPDSNDSEIQNPPKRRNRGTVVEKNDAVIEKLPKRSSRTRKTPVNELKNATPVVSVRKSSRNTKKVAKA